MNCTLQRASNILLEEFYLFRLHSDSRALDRTGPEECGLSVILSKRS